MGIHSPMDRKVRIFYAQQQNEGAHSTGSVSASPAECAYDLPDAVRELSIESPRWSTGKPGAKNLENCGITCCNPATIVTPHERSLQYVAVSAVSFVIFLFYIGLRIIAYPAVPEWWCGVAGIAALFIVPLVAGPGRRWVQESMERSAVPGSPPSGPAFSRS